MNPTLFEQVVSDWQAVKFAVLFGDILLDIIYADDGCDSIIFFADFDEKFFSVAGHRSFHARVFQSIFTVEIALDGFDGRFADGFAMRELMPRSVAFLMTRGAVLRIFGVRCRRLKRRNF